MYNNVAYLRRDTIEVDKYGNHVPGEISWHEVFVKATSVRQSEFYQAHQAGLKPSLVLIMPYAEEYEGEEVVKYNNTLYDVIRTYEYRGRMELTLERRTTNVDNSR